MGPAHQPPALAFQQGGLDGMVGGVLHDVDDMIEPRFVKKPLPVQAGSGQAEGEPGGEGARGVRGRGEDGAEAGATEAQGRHHRLPPPAAAVDAARFRPDQGYVGSGIDGVAPLRHHGHAVRPGQTGVASGQSDRPPAASIGEVGRPQGEASGVSRRLRDDRDTQADRHQGRRLQDDRQDQGAATADPGRWHPQGLGRETIEGQPEARRGHGSQSVTRRGVVVNGHRSNPFLQHHVQGLLDGQGSPTVVAQEPIEGGADGGNPRGGGESVHHAAAVPLSPRLQG